MTILGGIAQDCVHCRVCVRECAFLQKYGTPGEICRNFSEPDAGKSPVFECNLCGLCSAVCPKELCVDRAFLEIRRVIQRTNDADAGLKPVDPRHRRLWRYEMTGASALFRLHFLPDGGDTVFFPGCALNATRSSVTLKTYGYLQTVIDRCGIVLDCCFKPSHDLGLSLRFERAITLLADKLRSSGVTTIITACPSCHVTFREYLPEFNIRSVYEVLTQQPPVIAAECGESVAVHDTCTTRHSPEMQEAVRSLVSRVGMELYEMNHSRGRTLCCGEGGGAAFVAPELTSNWSVLRQSEAGTRRLVTYCAGCSSTFGAPMRTTHILDLLFDSDRARAGGEQRTRSPFTYLRRLLMKWRILLGK